MGQEHVALALSHAVAEGRVAHAYLFSGPRGTGKTSAARILAKALNCTAPSVGEPCDSCESCEAVRRGTSLDVVELDAASNSGVDSIRDLISTTAFATPGSWKVYIVDEIHMLSTAASNALLKTLEEPPSRVVFVLATTDPQKVLQTIRSRTQHYEFRLIGADTLFDLLAAVADRAELALPQGGLAAALKKGKGSARDALSALEQIAVLGRVEDGADHARSAVEALAGRDSRQVLVTVARAAEAGIDPARLAVEMIDLLREGFLSAVAPGLAGEDQEGRDTAGELVQRFGLARLVRAIEVLGRTLVDIRDSLDARSLVEAALLRLASPAADDSYGALLERVERLEQEVAARSAGAGEAGSTRAGCPEGAVFERPGRVEAGPTPASRVEAERTPAGRAEVEASRKAGGGPTPRPALGAYMRRGVPGHGGDAGKASGGAGTSRAGGGTAPGGAGTVPGGDSAAPTGVVTAPGGDSAHAADAPGALDRDDLVMAWGDVLKDRVSSKARSRFGSGRWVSAEPAEVAAPDGGAPEAGVAVANKGVRAVFAVPNEPYLSACGEVREEVEQELSFHFGVPVVVQLVTEESEGPGPPGRVEPPGRAGSVPTAEAFAAAGPSGGVEPPGRDSSPSGAAGSSGGNGEVAPTQVTVSPAVLIRQAFPGAEEI